MGRSRKTIQDINGIINKFLKWCRRNKYTTYRPDDVHIPRSARLKGKKILQPKDLGIVFTVNTTVINGKVIIEEFIHAFRLQILTGLRPGELRGLREEDVDGKLVSIKRAINVHGEVTGGKNDNAIRSFVLSDLAYKELQAQLDEYPSKNGYIFDLPTDTCYRKHWKRYCEVNGITCTTPYELRHTFVSVVKRLPVGEVKKLVGHSENMDTFDIYGHELEGEDVQTAETINKLFRKLINGKKNDPE